MENKIQKDRNFIGSKNKENTTKQKKSRKENVKLFSQILKSHLHPDSKTITSTYLPSVMTFPFRIDCPFLVLLGVKPIRWPFL